MALVIQHATGYYNVSNEVAHNSFKVSYQGVFGNNSKLIIDLDFPFLLVLSLIIKKMLLLFIFKCYTKDEEMTLLGFSIQNSTVTLNRRI